MGRILVGMQREPEIPREALAGAVVGVELGDRLPIDGDQILTRARVAVRIDKNVGDVRAIGRKVKTWPGLCRAAVAGEERCPGRDRPREPGPLDGRPARRERGARRADQPQCGDDRCQAKVPRA